MPHYITLGNFTDEGMRTIRDHPQRIAAADQGLAAGGVKVQRFFTLGQYDVVSICEAPDDEAMAVAALGIGSTGNVRTTTLKAFTQDEFLHLVEGLPSS
ncbi:MAG: GYD domain-containing protein [Chloroflexi bacterium]|nr:GYD domain-containing protein [Chloroflexota bacterium]